MEQRAECECGACRPGLRLVWDRKRGLVSTPEAKATNEVMAFAHDLMEQAERSGASGALCAMLGEDGRHRVWVVGSARRNHLLARGIVARLDDELAAMAT